MENDCPEEGQIRQCLHANAGITNDPSHQGLSNHHLRVSARAPLLGLATKIGWEEAVFNES